MRFILVVVKFSKGVHASKATIHNFAMDQTSNTNCHQIDLGKNMHVHHLERKRTVREEWRYTAEVAAASGHGW